MPGGIVWMADLFYDSLMNGEYVSFLSIATIRFILKAESIYSMR